MSTTPRSPRRTHVTDHPATEPSPAPPQGGADADPHAQGGEPREQQGLRGRGARPWELEAEHPAPAERHE